MKKDHRPPDDTPPPDVQAWLDSRSAQDRQELLRTWQWTALGRDEEPDTAATQAAWARLQATVQSPGPSRLAADRPADTPQRLPRVRKTALLLFLLLVGTTAVLYFWTGSADREQAAVVPAQQAHFMLLLRDNDPAPTTPEAQAAIVAEYTAWARELAAAGHFVGGDELAEEGYLLEGTEHPAVQPISDSSGMIGGYFIIAAADYDEALSIAKACPQLRHGGTVEVRPIVQR